MEFHRYCTAAVVLGLLAATRPISAQVEPIPGEATFNIFVRGTDVGREQVRLTRSGSQWIISATGRFGDATTSRFEVKYASDWQPIELKIDGARRLVAGPAPGGERERGGQERAPALVQESHNHPLFGGERSPPRDLTPRRASQ